MYRHIMCKRGNLYSETQNFLIWIFLSERGYRTSLLFNRSSDGIETLVLATTETGQSVARYKQRLFGFFCQGVAIFLVFHRLNSMLQI